MFPRTVQYALRLASYIAIHSSERELRGAEIAEATGVPPAYASKILRKLVNAGILTGAKGHGGGFSLARSPAKIRFAEVLESAAGGVLPTGCVFGLTACSERQPCALHFQWTKLRSEVASWAETTTLEDVIRDSKVRRKVLQRP